ncbi:MAG: helix-turn-helix domain-containing protein [Lachnospiraceae bacterium]
MKDRIKKIRTDAGLNQTDFAKKLSISRSAVCKIESGENNPSEQTLKLIQADFSVNENWLRTGEGEPYMPPGDDRAGYISDLLEGKDDEFCDMVVQVVKTYSDLDEKSKAVLREFAKKLADNIKGQG